MTTNVLERPTGYRIALAPVAFLKPPQQGVKRFYVIVAAGENGNDLNYFGLYLNKSVMVIIIKIYDRDRFL
jgi:hypothetical protein